MWLELSEAKKNSVNISREIEKLFKEQNSLLKKEIASHKEKLLTETDEAVSLIEEEYRELIKNLRNHRKALEAKSNFLRRHNKINFK